MSSEACIAALALVGLLAGPALAATLRRKAAVCAPFLLLLFPILRDGPLDIALPTTKLALVALLLAMTAPASRKQWGKMPTQVGFLISVSILILLLAHLLGRDPEVGINATKAFLTSSLYFFLCARLFDARFMLRGNAAIILVAASACALAFVQYATIRLQLSSALLQQSLPIESFEAFFVQGFDVDERGLRVASFYYHSNQLGHLLSMAFGVALPFSLVARRRQVRAGLVLFLSMVVACCALTQSRGAAGAITIEAMLILFLMRDRLRHRARSGLALAVLLGLSAVVLRENLAAFAERLLSAGLSGRDLNLRYGFDLVRENLVVGLGPGCSSLEIIKRFPVVDHSYHLNEYYMQRSFNAWASSPHNYYLTTILEVGIFGLLTRLLAYGLVVAAGVRIIRGSRSTRVRTIAISATIPLLIELVRGLIDSFDFLASQETGAISAFLMVEILYLSSLRVGPRVRR